ncbi:hypothetical protein GALMADRAFT_228844 [Galerina marginata CBS 339.88]|uniref:SWR1-complex protein 5 n=1 Tax=Galerina marginata (strain CBS 339.88) TaxID=685588 RepID=A0A067SNQ1_GALM3|nr:hypothetical protein GALMADRAFT_228844 [Galerina marginata CBS 339.88]
MTLTAKNEPASKLDSEDDNDEDYVPPEKQDSDSEPSEAEGGNDGNGAIPEATVDEETKKRTRDALWSSFQASLANPSKLTEAETSTNKMVKIERRYRFAGDEVVEVVEVPEDSQETKKWPLWKDSSVERKATFSTSSVSHSPVPMALAQDVKQSDASRASSSNSTPTPSSSNIGPAVVKPGTKRPGPRKPKTSLAPLPGPAKAKKLTTLDKSAMDWKSHLQAEQVAGSSIKDDLEANRRAGGYLEKLEFLKRVEDRKEENLDDMKSTKRRKL